MLFGCVIFCLLILSGALVYFNFYGQHSVETEEIYLDENLIFAQAVSSCIIDMNSVNPLSQC